MGNKNILVTGASGYIGGSVCILLKEHGYTVHGIDYVKDNHIVKYMDTFVKGDFNNFLTSSLGENNYSHVIHCAGTSLVGPSIFDPADYFSNNVAKTINLLTWIKDYSPSTKFMFSSSASVYKSSSELLTENSKIYPKSPYAMSKRIIEEIAIEYDRAYSVGFTIFRYFNACGAMGEFHGQRPDASHIFARLMESANRDEVFELNGDDFATRDGTCIRDYIHVRDIAQAHLTAIENKVTGIYNLGTGKGYSNREIINAVENKINKRIKVETVGRRPGDSASLVADSTRAKQDLPWQPAANLDIIIDDLIKWYSSDNYKRLEEKCSL